MDILEPKSGGKWDLIEVKMSTEPKEYHYWDVAFQKYVYEGAGIPIHRCYLLLIDNTYVRKGDIEPEKLFKKVDIPNDIEPFFPEVEGNLVDMSQIIKLRKPPEVKIGNHCSNPFDCSLMEKCWAFLPERNVFALTRGREKKMELFERGILAIKDIPDYYSLSTLQAIQVGSEKSGKSHIDKDKIQSFLRQLKYPLYFLDFEAFQTAIPKYDNSSPYEQIPFQYSLHVLPKREGKVQHYEFLAENIDDPRPNLLQQLEKDIGNQGSIVVYNQTFEKSVLKKCAERFLQYHPFVSRILERIVDLSKPFISFQYVSPGSKWKCILKICITRFYKETLRRFRNQ